MQVGFWTTKKMILPSTGLKTNLNCRAKINSCSYVLLRKAMAAKLYLGMHLN